MCLICIEFERERMTVLEARRALGEMVEGLEPGHAREVKQMLDEAAETERDEAEAQSVQAAKKSGSSTTP